MVYPSLHYRLPKDTCSVMLINRNLATNHWESLPLDSLDITVIRLTGEFSTLRIFNIYNDCTHSCSLTCLEQYLLSPAVLALALPIPNEQYSDIWLGDFNRHDPLWESPDNSQLFSTANLDAAEILIDLLADFGMNIMLDPGVPTLEHMVTKNLHRIDHVFCSHDFSYRFFRCKVLQHERPPKTDHFPIVSVIDLSVIQVQQEPKRNFRDTDWADFKKDLKVKLDRLTLRDPQDIEDFDTMLEGISNAITQLIADIVPLRHPSPHQKRWWTRELGQARTALWMLTKKAYKIKKRFPNHPLIDEFRAARNVYVQSVKDTRTQHWEDWIETTDRFSMWVMNKFVNASLRWR